MSERFSTLANIPTCISVFSKTGELAYQGQILNRLSFIKADITKLHIDAIANAANSSLLGGGGVDGAIHRAAGPQLLNACRQLGGCPTGSAKITPGFNLPSKYVIHCVGPFNKSSEALRSCYATALELCSENDIKSVAFPCISTGIYGFPNRPAAEIAVDTVWKYLEAHSEIERVIFCCFLDEDYSIYYDLLLARFEDGK